MADDDTTPEASKEDLAFAKLEGKITQFLKNEGLSNFSAKVAFGFLQSQLNKEGGSERMKHVVAYLQQSLSGRRTTDETNPLQKGCPNVLPGLRAHPFWNVSDNETFPWLRDLERSFEELRGEFMTIVGDEGATLFQPYRSPPNKNKDDGSIEDDLGQQATTQGAWNVCYLHLHGLDFESNLERLPKIATALKKIPRYYNHSFLSALVPGTTIKPHFGPTNKKLRCHLPLLVPPSVGGQASELVCSGEHRQLYEGRCVIFDDSFEHYSVNRGDSPRVVLIFDTWHPDLSQEEIKFLSFINTAQVKAARKMKEKLQEDSSDFLSIIERSRKKAGDSGNDDSNGNGTVMSAVQPEDIWGFNGKGDG
jgi:aspartate beta-hydroxylase